MRSRWRTDAREGMAILGGTEVFLDVVRQCVVIDTIVAAEDDDATRDEEETEYWGVSGYFHSERAVELPRQITLTRNMLNRLAELVDPTDYSTPKSRQDEEAAANGTA